MTFANTLNVELRRHLLDPSPHPAVLTALSGGGISESEAQSIAGVRVAAHEAEVNPHPQYDPTAAILAHRTAPGSHTTEVIANSSAAAGATLTEALNTLRVGVAVVTSDLAFHQVTTGAHEATNLSYDGTVSGLVATTVQTAVDAVQVSIDELNSLTEGHVYLGGSYDDLTEFETGTKGLDLLSAVDAAAGRSTLGLVIGTNVQAYDAALQSVAGLATAADQMLYTTASDTYAVATLTTAGRALLDDADATAQRSTLGLGTMATATAANYGPLASANTWSAAQTTAGSAPGSVDAGKTAMGGGVIRTAWAVHAPSFYFDGVELDAYSLALPQALADHGRFAGAGRDSLLLSDSTDPFVAGSFFATYNGSTFAECGKFIHDNTDNGGSAGSMTASTNALLTAIGRTGSSARYGVEFRICEITAGSGTGASTVFGAETLYLCSINGDALIAGPGTMCSILYWLRATEGNIGLWATDGGTIYIDGVAQAGNYTLTTAAGWVHVMYVQPIALGYDSGFPRIYSASGRTAQIALPFLARGFAMPSIHTAPIASSVAVL